MFYIRYNVCGEVILFLVNAVSTDPSWADCQVSRAQNNKVRVRSVVEAALAVLHTQGLSRVERGGLQSFHHAAPGELGELGEAALHGRHGAGQCLQEESCV